MMMKVIRLFLLLTLFVNCSIFNGQKGSSRPIEGKIIFSITEGYPVGSVTEPKIKLSLRTEKIYPCCNWIIKTDIRIENNEIIVRLLGIYVPEICLTAFGPAVFMSFLNIPEGKYSLCFYSEEENTVSYTHLTLPTKA